MFHLNPSFKFLFTQKIDVADVKNDAKPGGDPNNALNVLAIHRGDVTADNAPRTEYKPPTAADIARNAFAAQGKPDARTRLGLLIELAQREYTQPLILFGKPDDPACVELFGLFQKKSASEPAVTVNGANENIVPSRRPIRVVGDLRWEFELLNLDTRNPDVRALAKDLKIADDDLNQARLLIVNNDRTPKIGHPLAKAGGLSVDVNALFTFLNEQKPPTRDAERMLADALALAKAQNKRVFFTMSASWCGPCRQLSGFLSPRKSLLEPYFVFLKTDTSRDLHAQQIMDRYQGEDAHNGIPWTVILDAQGKLLMNSSLPGESERGPGFSTNIGFPSSPPAIEHFLRMLSTTAPGIPAGTLERFREDLSKKP